MGHLPLETALQQIKAAGYHGIELAIDPNKAGYEQAATLCDQYGLLLLAQHPYAKGTTPAALLEDYTTKLEKILQLQPLLVNCHTGKDYYSVAQNLPFLQAAAGLSQQYGIPVAHEIHRGRFSFCTTATAQYLEAFPSLLLTADFSHWCVVSESLLEEQSAFMDQVIPHCIHLHARVGYEQGPQVSHPAASEFQSALQAHMQWWKQLVQHHRQQGKTSITITCEFGPTPYLPAIPFTRAPVAIQWELNLFMKNYLTENLLT